MTSHGRLLLFIDKYNDPNVFARVYLKVQLVSLCEAYEVNFRRSDTKKNLLRNHTSIPFIAPVDDRQYQVAETETDATNGSVRMRFRLSGKYSLKFINLIDAGYGQVFYRACLFFLHAIFNIELRVSPLLKGPGQPPPFSMPSKLLIAHGATKFYCFTVSCVPGLSMCDYYIRTDIYAPKRIEIKIVSLR